MATTSSIPHNEGKNVSKECSTMKHVKASRMHTWVAWATFAEEHGARLLISCVGVLALLSLAGTLLIALDTDVVPRGQDINVSMGPPLLGTTNRGSEGVVSPERSSISTRNAS